MGGDAQPQIVLQVLIRLLRHGSPPGEAIGGPRWMLSPGESGFETWDHPDGAPVEIENGAPTGWADGLRARGHRVTEPGAESLGVAFGHAHLIESRADGVLAGAADPRARVGAVAGH
jgi:gamma-glutamyltranspeptidase/glutathione hydrolase